MKPIFKKSLWFVGLAIVALLIAVGLLWVGGDEQGNVSFLANNKLPLMVFRITLIAALIIFWPQLVNYFSKRNAWPEQRVTYMRRLRWRVAALLVIVEVVIIQDLLGKLF